MKINENGRISPLQAYQKNNISAKTSKGATSAGRDEVTISSEALEMARGGASSVNAEQRAAREQKVEQIKQAVQNGTYEIDAQKIADTIIKNLLGE